MTTGEITLPIFPRAFAEAFRGKRAGLVDKVDVSHGLLNELLDREVITSQQAAHAKSMTSEHDRVNKLLELLEKRDDKLFPSFCQALAATDQLHIVKDYFMDEPAQRTDQLTQFARPSQRQGGATGGRNTLEFARFRESGLPKLSRDKLPAEVTKIPFSQLTNLHAMAEGGFGIVYRATHVNWGVVAYKQLKAAIIKENDRIAKELVKEAQMHVLRHPNIVAMLAVTFEPNHYGVVFEYVTYGGLDGFYETYQVGWLVKLTIAHGTIQGMNYLHTRDQPVIHCDLKVQNILLDDDFMPKICDFGLSKWRRFSTTRTDSSSQRGTVTHIPPENWKNINERRTVKYDIYGFGVLLWELLSEESPFRNAGGNVAQIEAAVIAGQRPDLDDIKREEGDGTPVAEEMVKFAIDCIELCWHQEPTQRPTFAALNDTFQNFLADKQDGVKTARDNLNEEINRSLQNGHGY